MEKYKVTKIILTLLFVFVIITGGRETSSALEVNATVTRNTKHDAAIVSLSQKEFEKVGFNLGDSCDIVFSNGYTLSDVPYYNGYYVKYGAPVIVAYPGSSNIGITLNHMGIWQVAALTDGDIVTIRLNTRGKYSVIQDCLGHFCSSNRADYNSDEVFCNFRPLSAGKLKSNFFFRGASPIDNIRGRAALTDKLLSKNGIKLVLNLADSLEEVEKYRSKADYSSPYTTSLYKKGKIILLDMNTAYQSKVYQEKLVYGLKQILKKQGPVYIHCLEGKDRTGFVCMLLEALAGASYEEMCSDYMLTYKNYYCVDPVSTPEKYKAIVNLYFDSFLCFLCKTEDTKQIQKGNYIKEVTNYLLAGGMTKGEIEILKKYITE